MKESLENTFIFNIIIVFLIIIMFLLVGSISYTKTYKIKNQLITIIEKYRGFDRNAEDEINDFLSKTGYRINPNGVQNCKKRKTESAVNGHSKYRYCIYQFKQENEGTYYGVVAYAYFDVPLIGELLEIPVYGETKIFYEMIY